MDTAMLEDLLVLAEEMNFTAAASRRHLTQPAFSRRIRALENWIGTPLMARTSRSVVLTPAGHAFLPRAGAILRDLRRAREEAQEVSGDGQRGLTIAATHALSFTFVPKWVMSQVDQVQFGSINLISGSYEDCEARLLRGDTPFLICHAHPDAPGPAQSPQFISLQIGTDHLVPVCSPDESGAPRWTPGQDAVPYLAYAPQSGLARVLEAAWSNSAPRPRLQPRFQSYLAATLLAMAREGLGVAWVPQSLAQPDLSEGALLVPGGAELALQLDILLIRSVAPLNHHAESFWRGLSG